MRGVLLLLIVVGCGTSDRPIGPGGGGPGGSGTLPGVDGGSTLPDATPADVVVGVLCDLVDLRQPALCSTENLAGVTVESSTSSAVANNQNEFVVRAPEQGTVVLQMARTDINRQSTVLPIAQSGRTGVIAPVVSDITYIDLLTNLGVLDNPGRSVVAVYIRNSAGGPVENVVVQAPMGTQYFPHYDGSSANDWSTLQGDTGVLGAALLFGVPADAPTVSIGLSKGGTSKTIENVPVRAGAITFISGTF